MKKILIADFLCVEAHRTVNLNLIKQIVNVSHNVSLISINDYYRDNEEELSKQGVYIIDLRVSGDRYGKLKGKLHIMKIMKLTSEIASRGHFDLIVSLAYDTVAAIYGKFLFRNSKICIFNHKNIDELVNPVLAFLFRIYKNNYIHLVFEKPFRDYLKSKYNVKQVYVIPHPLIMNFKFDLKEGPYYDCVALCNSNDEKMLDSLTDSYNSEMEGISILARSKKHRSNKGHLFFLKGFIEYEKYYSLLSNTKYVFVPLPEFYKYRLSASIYDALALQKPVITTSKFYSDSLNCQYPGVCQYVSGASELLSVLNENIRNDVNQKSFDSFIEQHSDEYIKNTFEKLIKKINI